MAGTALEGIVLSVKDKTLRVRVQRLVKHPFFGKFRKLSRSYSVHDPFGGYQVGDLARIRPSRPYSKTKTWEVVPEGVQDSQKEGVKRL